MFQSFLFIVIFLIGLTVGSFLNCLIYRMELQEDMPKGSPQRKAVSFLRGKSFCPHCRHTLFWQDLIPVFSFIFLKGKCRYCQKPISFQYPVVEILTAAIFLLIYNLQPPLLFTGAGLGPDEYGLWFLIFNLINLFYYWIISCFLIVIFVYDLKHYIIPDKIVYPAIIIALIYNLQPPLLFTGAGLGPDEYGLWFSIFKFSILSALGAALFFLAIVLISRGRWMGIGDIKLAFLMGLVLGYPNILVALFLAFFIGASVGLALIALNKKSLKSEIPFGPFLISGTFLALFFGSQIISWYQSVFLI